MKYNYEQFLRIILLQKECLKPLNQLQDLLQYQTLHFILFHANISASWELT